MCILASYTQIACAGGIEIEGKPITETPAYYTTYIKYLTVPPDSQNNPDFNSPNIALIKALEDPIRREIFNKMISCTNETFRFITLNDATQHWQMRIRAIDLMTKMNALTVNFGYFDAEKDVPVSVESSMWKKGAGNPLYFELKAGNNAYDGIRDLLAHKTRGDCLGAINACIFDAVAEAVGKAAFNAAHPDGSLILGQEKGSCFPSHTRNAIDTAVRIPGDYLYMQNKDDYSAQAAKNHIVGYWQGENCLYIGAGKYSGLGADSRTEDELREEMKEQYLAVRPDIQKFPGDPATEIRFTGHKRLRIKQ